MTGAAHLALERDRLLLARARGGDPAAFEELYRLHAPAVLRMALRFAGREAEAQDVLQEAFLHVLDRLATLELSAQLTTYLYPVVRNLARRAREKAGRLATDEDALRALEDLAAEPRAEGADGELGAALRRLPEEKREVVLLRFVDGLTVAEIAHALEVPEGTVKSRLHHALAALREDADAAEWLR